MRQEISEAERLARSLVRADSRIRQRAKCRWWSGPMPADLATMSAAREYIACRLYREQRERSTFVQW